MSISTRNQCQIVLKHLIDHGYITQLIATNYGVRRLASRVYDLKAGGVLLNSNIERDDSGTKYARYTMEQVDRDLEANRLADGYSYASDKKLRLAA